MKPDILTAILEAMQLVDRERTTCQFIVPAANRKILVIITEYPEIAKENKLTIVKGTDVQ